MSDSSTARVASRRGGRTKITPRQAFGHKAGASRRSQKKNKGHIGNLVTHARKLFKEKDYEGALTFLRKHGAKHISSARLQSILGRVHAKLDHPKRALTAFKAAHDIDPTDPATIRGYANFMQNKGDLGAEDIMFQAITIDGGFNASNLVMLGNLYRAWGQQFEGYNELALVCYREASEHTNFKGKPEDLYEELRGEMGVACPATPEMDVIADRMTLIGVEGVKVHTSLAYRLNQ